MVQSQHSTIEIVTPQVMFFFGDLQNEFENKYFEFDISILRFHIPTFQLVDVRLNLNVKFNVEHDEHLMFQFPNATLQKMHLLAALCAKSKFCESLFKTQN
jgi:hypothetical protein